MEERIKDLLYNNPHVSDRTRDFLRSLLHSQKTWGKLTDPQLHALQRIESQNTDDAIAKKEEWRKNYSEQHRELAIIAAYYYCQPTTGQYFHDIAQKILEDPDFIPTEKQWRAMCENKYAKKVIESTKSEPKYPVGSFVSLRGNHAKHIKLFTTSLPAMVLGHNVAPVVSPAKGSKLYSVLPVGAAKEVLIEERYIKKCKVKS